MCAFVLLCVPLFVTTSVGFHASCVDQEHSSDEADTSQPAAETLSVRCWLGVTLHFSQTKGKVMMLHLLH